MAGGIRSVQREQFESRCRQDYIEHQAGHHRKRSYESEFEAMLWKSGIVFDPNEASGQGAVPAGLAPAPHLDPALPCPASTWRAFGTGSVVQLATYSTFGRTISNLCVVLVY